MKANSICLRIVRPGVLALALLLSAAPLRAQYEVDLSFIDYFNTSGEVPVASSGGDVEIEFGFYSSGPPIDALRSLVAQAIEAADCNEIFPVVAVIYT